MVNMTDVSRVVYASLMSETSGQRLKQARIAAGFATPTMAHRRFGWPVSTINAHENGQNNLRPPIAERYADAYGVRPEWLLMLRDDGGPGESANELTLISAGDLVPVRIAGTLEAGAFREVDEFIQLEPVTIFEPRDPRFPNARMMGFDVAGDSMNDLKPRPIIPGDRVVCIDFEDLRGRVPLRDGMVVVVEQVRDGGHLREWSVKQLEYHADRVEFWPRSTNPKHKPIVVPHNFEADDGRTVSILALVRRVTNELPL